MTQNRSQVIATKASGNGAIGTNGRLSFGFTGAWSGSDPVLNTVRVRGWLSDAKYPTSVQAGPETLTGDGQVTIGAYSVTIS